MLGNKPNAQASVWRRRPESGMLTEENMTRRRSLSPIRVALAICLGTAAMPAAHAERLPLPAKGAKLVEAHSFVRKEPVIVERSSDYTTWLEWSAVPDSEITFETRKAGVIDVRYVLTSTYYYEDGVTGPAGISIEIDGARINALESSTENFDVEGLELGESADLGPILGASGQHTLQALSSIPAGNHVVRIVIRPSGRVMRYTGGLNAGVGTCRFVDQNLIVLVFS